MLVSSDPEELQSHWFKTDMIFKHELIKACIADLSWNCVQTNLKALHHLCPAGQTAPGARVQLPHLHGNRETTRWGQRANRFEEEIKYMFE